MAPNIEFVHIKKGANLPTEIDITAEDINVLIPGDQSYPRLPAEVSQMRYKRLS